MQLRDQVESFEQFEWLSVQKGYRLHEELGSPVFKSGAKVLDVGSGNGVMSRYLRQLNSSITVKAVDSSEIRIRQAKVLGETSSAAGIDFICAPLDKMPFESASFDHIFSRYVFEYIENPLDVCHELFRVCRVDGKITVVGMDGILINIFNGDRQLESEISFLQKNINTDPHVARKLPKYLRWAGFNSIEWRVDVVDFQGSDRAVEHANASQRLSYATPTLLSVFQSEKVVNDFKQRYLSAILDPTSTVFYNKFIIQAQK